VLEHQGPVRGAEFSRDESRVLTWSDDKTARVWLLDADLDFPAEHIPLWVQAVTGSEYDFAEHRLMPLDPDRWREIRPRYQQIAAEHAKKCKYPDANHWMQYEQKFHANPALAGE
jgi:hypothetical protein